MEISELSEETGKLAALKLALTDWEKKPLYKLGGVFLLWVIAFLKFPVFSLIPFFPTGFIYYFAPPAIHSLDEFPNLLFGWTILGWVTYLIITVMIFLFKNKIVVRVLFLILALLLFLNVSGCAKITEGFQ